MMKKILSLASLLLAVLMIAMCCAACGGEKKNDDATPAPAAASDTPAETVPAETEAPTEPAPATIVGSWRYKLLFERVVEAVKEDALAKVEDGQKAYIEEMFKCFNGVSMTLMLEFREDGTYKTSLDESTRNEAIDKIKSNLKALLPSIFEAMGIPADQLESQLEDAGYTLESYAEMLFSQMDTASLFEDVTSEGSYRLDGDKLYLSGEDGTFDDSGYATVQFTADTLEITDIFGDNDENNAVFRKILLPLVFERG